MFVVCCADWDFRAVCVLCVAQSETVLRREF